jgi:septal ring factor EnvC (AmiA/AmiB activator)
MNTVRIAGVATAAALLFPLSPTAATAAESCASRAEIRMDVADFVHGLRDDVTSRSARAATAAALVETVRTFRGANADTAAERSALAEQILELAHQLKDAPGGVERKALALQIKALVEQRDRDGITAEERAELRRALAALRNALVKRADTAAEAQAVATFAKGLVANFAPCP